MDLTSVPPVSLLLTALAHGLAAAVAAADPVVGSAAPLVAIAAFTIVVRLLLVPFSAARVRAERDRRRIAPAVAALRRRHAADPARLQRELQRLHSAHGVSPTAGCLPTVAQAPVLAAVYAVFVHPVIAGNQNALLGLSFAGAPLGGGLAAALATPSGGWTALAVLAVLALLVWANSRAARLRLGAEAPAGAAAVLARVLPFVTVVFAAIAPLAAAIYLIVSSAWTLGENAVLHRLAGESPV